MLDKIITDILGPRELAAIRNALLPNLVTCELPEMNHDGLREVLS